MQEIEGLVSIVIPAYNAAGFLPDTLNSVKKQSYSKWEVIVVDDGSEDSTQEILQNEKDDRIRSIKQKNAGVSAARNNGLMEARGEYVIFLDADDLLTELFIQVRLNALLADASIGFTGGQIETFPLKSVLKNAAGESPEKEILFFEKNFATVPSNYLFRKKVLIDTNVRFNVNLSSTADRFFILQLSKYAKGKSIRDEKGKLLYRVSDNSMSHRVTPKLILDNEQFYKELEQSGMLPAGKYRRFKSLYFYSLAMGFMKIKYFKSFVYYLMRSFYSSPANLFKILIKRATLSFR